MTSKSLQVIERELYSYTAVNELLRAMHDRHMTAMQSQQTHLALRMG